MKIDRILRSRRKTLALIVRSDGSLEVRAPLRLSRAEIQAFVESKAAWIARQRARLSAADPPPARIGYANGSRLWLLGQSLRIEYTRSTSGTIRAAGQCILIPARMQSNAGAALESWYRAQARRVIRQRADYYAGKHGLRYSGIRISAARSRWGSCGVNNRLNFPYRLVMAPIEVIDYVVVHELVHTVERNHSRAFWAKVAEILPDYRLEREWLKRNGRWLDLAFEADPEKIRPVVPLKRSRRRAAAV